MSKEIAEEYASSLSDLTVNSKPLINMLTILAEENVEHAGVIVETVEKHLEKVSADIKLPVLYLVDSIIKNVGGAYTQKFSQSIVNMFTKTFKQVDEKTRSQMFKLRETWHDVFPSTKLYQLDVKVNLIDPAWPIQAQPQQSNIHVNPNFLKKPAPTTSIPPVTEEEERMRSILAKKEQELLMLQRKKVEMELEQTRRQLQMAEKTTKKLPSAPVGPVPAAAAPAPVALVTPVPAEHVSSVKQRLGPPVNKPAGAGRIAPVSAALVSARRDPRLARRQLISRPNHNNAPPQVPPTHHAVPPILAQAPIAPNVFDIKPLERAVTKRKNVITIDVRPEMRDPRQERDRSDRSDKSDRPERLEKPDRQDRPRPRKRPDERRTERDKQQKPEKEIPEKEKEKEKSEKDLSKTVDEYLGRLQIPDSKKINKLPPIPKIIREDKDDPPPKKKKEMIVRDKKKKREGKDSSSSSPEKRQKTKEKKVKIKEPVEAEEKPAEPEVVAFKELKNFHKERYMRRNKEKSESPEKMEKEVVKPPVESKSAPEIVAETKDVDLRVLHPVITEAAAPIAQKRPSIEALENKVKKNKLDKFDILFGNEDVDLRQLPQVEEVVAPPPPIISQASLTTISSSVPIEPSVSATTVADIPCEPYVPSVPVTSSVPDEIESENLPDETNVSKAPSEHSDSESKDNREENAFSPKSPILSPKKDWNEVKEKEKEEVKKTPSKLDLVRAKLAEATKGKDRLGRPLRFPKSPSVERERRRTLSSEDIDLRTETEEFDADDHKKTISIIMSQAKEQYSDGQLDKNQYNTLMYQVLQLNEKLKLKEAKQRESLEISKRKLNATVHEENHKVSSPKSTPSEVNNFGDIDERVPPSFMEVDNQNHFPMQSQDSDMRINPPVDMMEPINPAMLPMPPIIPPMFMGPFPPMWRGQPPMMDDLGPRRFRAPIPPFFRGKFDKRVPRLLFDPIMPIPPLPAPMLGMCQGENPLKPYERTISPPPLGAPGYDLPPTDFRILEYIDQDPVKTIQIDGVPREIRYYGDTAVIMLDWDDPREIKFLPGCRRVTFDNKDSIVLNFNEGYKQVEIDDQVFDIKFGGPTREMYINGRWYECFFGGQPFGVLIDGKPRLIHLEGPLPQVDIGKVKRTDLVAGKINLIINATQVFPVYLDAKVQKFQVNGQFFTIRFVDSLRTVLINEQPFKVEFGDLPKPIFLGTEKYFVRFSALPKNIKPGQVDIADMEGSALPNSVNQATIKNDTESPMETDADVVPERPQFAPSPDGESQGLEMLASLMPTSMAPASSSEYSSAEPLFAKPKTIPGLETPVDETPNPAPSVPVLGNINVNDLFAKLVASGIVPMINEVKKDPKSEEKVEEVKPKPKEDRNVIHKVDLLKPETLRVKQPGLVARLYGGMQCSGCGARFPPERTVRYSQHLDWHFRQNRRERDSARRAHSRHWHYDLPDWLQYEECEDLEEREKSWFETGGAAGAAGAGGTAGGGAAEGADGSSPSAPAPAPLQACALCGDIFHQFYNEDHDEWHLRNSVKVDDTYYHPLCYEDYKASLAKEEPPKEETVDVKEAETIEEAIEIKDADDADVSDTESVVEVVEPETELPEPVEIEEELEDEGEEDDVVLKAEPVEQVVVEDADTDDETAEERAVRDREHQEFAKVKIKIEPIDPDDEPIITGEEETPIPTIDIAHQTVTSSIDGNVQLEQSIAPARPAGAIRINISKTLPTPVPHDDRLEDVSADEEPPPPGEETELEYTLKPSLVGVQFSRQPPVVKDHELSGLCSIM